MALPSVTYTFVSGTPSDANQVNTNFLDIINSLTDGTKSLTVNDIGLAGSAASQIVATDGSKILQSLTTATYPSLTELSYVKGVTIAIQTQFTGKATATVWGASAWTPTGSWSTNTTYTGSYRRIGDTGFFTVKIALAGAPTAANLTVNLPGSHTIDTAKLPGYDSTFKEVGLASFFDTSASAGYTGMACYNSTTSVKVMINAQAIHAGTVFTRLLACDNASPVTFASGDMVTLTFSVPIVEYT